MTCILGIDPGISGAVAFYFTEAPSRIVVEDVPVVAGEINARLLADRIKNFGPSIAIIERVSAMPKQGVVSMFNFGVSFGQVRGVVSALEIPLHYVTPAKWKKHFRLASDKEEARELAIRMFSPCAASFARKKDHGRAEAALIARYGFETLFPASAAA
jgi:hypothetical protein